MDLQIFTRIKQNECHQSSNIEHNGEENILHIKINDASIYSLIPFSTAITVQVNSELYLKQKEDSH